MFENSSLLRIKIKKIKNVLERKPTFRVCKNVPMVFFSKIRKIKIIFDTESKRH